MDADCLAKYQGICAWCTEKIEIGSEIKYWRSNVYHYPHCKNEAYREDNRELSYEAKTKVWFNKILYWMREL